ncbi:signal peptidase I [Peptostreptococcaceae bacterium AS15]|nr:signal peptidase I [Peptostreptococcaceae bacterium AS15]
MNNSIKKEIIEWIKSILFAIVIAFIITIFISPTVVKGESMYPTLQNNNYIILNKTAYWFSTPKRGDIVVFKSHIKDEKGKDKDLVKRVIGLPGDHIEIKYGNVYVNEELQNETYINGDYTDGSIDLIVPEGKIFAMGDNRPNSFDSRADEIGTIDINSEIIGKALIRLYPFNEINFF